MSTIKHEIYTKCTRCNLINDRKYYYGNSDSCYFYRFIDIVNIKFLYAEKEWATDIEGIRKAI